MKITSTLRLSKTRLTASTKPSIKKLGKGTNTAPAGNLNNHGKVQSQPFVFDDLTISMINSLCAKKQAELEKIYDTEYSKSRPTIYLKSLKGTENIPWLYDTGAQVTCLSEKLFQKLLKKIDQNIYRKQKVHMSRGTTTRTSGCIAHAIYMDQ